MGFLLLRKKVPKKPPPRTMLQEGTESLEAQRVLRPQELALERELLPQYLDMELQSLRTVLPEVDRLSAQSVKAQRQADVEDVLRLGPQSLEALRTADPRQAELMDLMSAQAVEELKLGSKLDPYMQREVQQSVRAGQAARGMGLGPSDLYEEALAQGEFGQNLRNQRRAFAGGVTGLRSQVYGDPFMRILGRPATALPYASNMGSAAAHRGGVDLFSPYASDLHNTNYNAAYAERNSVRNYNAAITAAYMQMVGSIAGGATKAGVACWVARECFGADNPQWLLFRTWLLNDAPRWFRNLYLRYGQRFARWIADKPKVKALVRAWMIARITNGA